VTIVALAPALLTPGTQPLRPVGRRPRLKTPRTAGPALLVAAGYVDPGNWGSDVAAGSQFGVRLLWVLATAMLVALFFQQLSVRLGLATGSGLTQLLRLHLPLPLQRLAIPPLVLALLATEVIEVFGVVLGVQMLTGWSPVPAVLASIAMILLVLFAPGGMTRGVVYALLGAITVVYLTYLAQQGSGPVVAGLTPGTLPGGSFAIIAALVGSVIMPHNLLLHSALSSQLQPSMAEAPVRSLRRKSLVTSALALGLALAVNMAITILAARSVASGPRDISSVVGGLAPAYGQASAAIFALTLLAAGLASSTTSGMITVDAFALLIPKFRLPAAGRRLLLVLPAALLVIGHAPEISVILWSQILLTCALPTVMLPMLWLCGRADVMGHHQVVRVSTRVVGALLAITITALGALSVACV
jgi:manganese transport protein